MSEADHTATNNSSVAISLAKAISSQQSRLLSTQFTRQFQSSIASVHIERKLSTVSAVVSLVIVVLSFAENEAYYAEEYADTPTVVCLRVLLGLLSFSQVLIVVVMERVMRTLKLHSSVWSVLGKVLVSLCFLPPWVNYAVVTHQISIYSVVTLSDIAVVLALLRLYFFIDFLYYSSPYLKPRNSLFRKLLARKLTKTFVLKSYVKDHPYLYICLTSITLLIISGLLLRVFERTIPESSFFDIWTGFWVGGVTQTTVGYGDVVPFSHAGRVICIVSCLFSVYLSSFMVMVVHTSLDLTKDELTLLAKLTVEMKDNGALKGAMAVVIQHWWKLLQSRKRKLSRLSQLRSFNKSLIGARVCAARISSRVNLGLQQELTTTGAWIQKHTSRVSDQMAQLNSFIAASQAIADKQSAILQKVQSLLSVEYHTTKTTQMSSSTNQSSKIQKKKGVDRARKKFLFQRVT